MRTFLDAGNRIKAISCRYILLIDVKNYTVRDINLLIGNSLWREIVQWPLALYNLIFFRCIFPIKLLYSFSLDIHV